MFGAAARADAHADVHRSCRPQRQRHGQPRAGLHVPRVTNGDRCHAGLGDTSLTVHGSGFLNFSPGTNTLTFAGVTPSNLVVVDDATLACIAPAGANGTAADVVVSNGNGTGTLPAGLTYHALPATTAVTPDHGTPLGGTVVTLTGSGFSANGAGGNTITFDGVAATGIVVVDDSTVTCTAPADLHRRRVSG